MAQRRPLVMTRKETWSMADVGRFLTNIGLGTHATAFESAGIAGRELEMLNDAHLKELGMGLKDRLHFSYEISRFSASRRAELPASLIGAMMMEVAHSKIAPLLAVAPTHDIDCCLYRTWRPQWPLWLRFLRPSSWRTTQCTRCGQLRVLPCRNFGDAPHRLPPRPR